MWVQNGLTPNIEPHSDYLAPPPASKHTLHVVYIYMCYILSFYALSEETEVTVKSSKRKYMYNDPIGIITSFFLYMYEYIQ